MTALMSQQKSKLVSLAADARVGLIATMPRSGTWYNNLFFNFYDQIVRGEQDLVFNDQGKFSVCVSIEGVDCIVVSHLRCPGFDRCRELQRDIWALLPDEFGGHNSGRSMIDRAIGFDRVEPQINPNARIAYYYRNPLDQAVSYYQQMVNHVDERYRLSQKSSDTQMFGDPREFFFKRGLDSYLKQYFTYHVMKDLYPDHLLLITYEELVRSPRRTFVDVLIFFGHNTDSPDRQTMIDDALDLSSTESVKRIEMMMGHSLANDQIGATGSHLNDGAIGKWKNYFVTEDMKTLEARCAEFGISLDEFTFE